MEFCEYCGTILDCDNYECSLMCLQCQNVQAMHTDGKERREQLDKIAKQLNPIWHQWDKEYEYSKDVFKRELITAPHANDDQINYGLL